jgi:hypothetical protein
MDYCGYGVPRHRLAANELFQTAAAQSNQDAKRGRLITGREF